MRVQLRGGAGTDGKLATYRGGTPGAAPQITAAIVPPIVSTPTAADAITFVNNTVTIPN